MQTVNAETGPLPDTEGYAGDHDEGNAVPPIPVLEGKTNLAVLG
jgi:hypothetical protein